MIKKYLLSFCFLLLSLPLAIACSCIFVDNFCETISHHEIADSIWVDLVARVRIDQVRNDGMDVQILTRLHGTEARETIFINKGNGADCRVNTDAFNRGDEYLMALHQGQNDYNLFICGITYLPIENDIVKGQVTPTRSNVAFDKLEKLSSCGNLEADNLSSLIEVLPNPFSTQLEINMTLSRPMRFQIHIYNVIGQLVMALPEQEYEDADKVVFSTSDWAAGIYLVQLLTKEERTIVKVVKSSE